jgi:hypothetical protein
LNVGVLLDKFANSAQVDCTNPYIASLIFFALEFVIGLSGTYKGSLRFGLPWGPSLMRNDWFKKKFFQIMKKASRESELGAIIGMGKSAGPCLTLFI